MLYLLNYSHGALKGWGLRAGHELTDFYKRCWKQGYYKLENKYKKLIEFGFVTRNSGSFSIPIHSPYFQPLLSVAGQLFLSDQPKELGKPPVHFLKSPTVGKADDPEPTHEPVGKPNMVKPEKWRRASDASKAFNKFKNSAELMSMRDPQLVSYRRPVPKTLPKYVKSYSGRDTRKPSKKAQNLENFIRLIKEESVEGHSFK